MSKRGSWLIVTKRGRWLICVLAVSASAGCGKAVRPTPCECAQIPSPPASLMEEPKTEQRVRAELFEPPETATTRSEGSRTTSEG